MGVFENGAADIITIWITGYAEMESIIARLVDGCCRAMPQASCVPAQFRHVLGDVPIVGLFVDDDLLGDL